MHSLINKYQLKGQIRWIKAQTDRTRNGELYRCISDTKGAFVQVYNQPKGDNILARSSRLMLFIKISANLVIYCCTFQPAFYEAFGLTVIESMTCGLPTIATCHGGPAEIIVDGVSGLHIDPYHSDKAADILVNFFDKCKEDPSYWDKISQGGLQRIYDKYVIFSPAIYLHL